MFLLLVTLISLVLALTMTVIAWRVWQEDQRRSAARVAVLAAEIHEPAGAHREAPPADRDLSLRPAAANPAVNMFAASTDTKPGARLALAVVMGAIVFGSAAAVAVVFGRGGSHDGTARRDARANAAAAPAVATVSHPSAAIPLELVALGHERSGDQLMVHGVIRNPRAGTAVNGLTAVVFLFKSDGGFSGSGRAAIESAAFLPGSESTFAVTVPGANDVARYRVSFRTEDRVVPHVDRRGHTQEKS